VEQNRFDIIVIGGGHAGIEASNIATELGVKTLLISMKDVALGSAPCNPSIGGVGKGQVVQELDALGGLMGKFADLAGIQYRTLNESKGFAVQSTRIQIDKDLYSKVATEYLENNSSLSIHLGKVLSIEKNAELFSVKCDNSSFLGSKVIITAGTFLKGKLHFGKIKKEGGRSDSTSATASLEDLVPGLNKSKQRFKTGTPARLHNKSIDFSKLEIQPSDSSTRNIHILNSDFERNSPQVACYLTRTNEKTMNIIRENKESSPMYNGEIQGVGARYCPSIEDKAYRYPDKHIHHVFIEPEGLNSELMYPSGISSSLPEDIQDKFIKTIDGLANAEIVQPGYAVEYDVIDTTELDICLMTKKIPGLYFAGQINGTSGYEEAAGQGFIAGINASLAVLERKPFVLRRTDSYIGVMIEDLITNTRDEPYRLFTARAENRLFIREDNAFLRMSPYRASLQLKEKLDIRLEELINEYKLLKSIVAKVSYKNFYGENDPFSLNMFLVEQNRSVTLKEILKISWINPIDVLTHTLKVSGLSFSYLVIRTIAVESKYEGYITRSNEQTKKISTMDSKSINLDRILQSENISYECKQRIEKIKPVSFGQLQRINGLRAATLAIIASGSY
jgi:tRNA uridine 5-carboxymethylaminomethyl modification enzyme